MLPIEMIHVLPSQYCTTANPHMFTPETSRRLPRLNSRYIFALVLGDAMLFTVWKITHGIIISIKPLIFARFMEVIKITVCRWWKAQTHKHKRLYIVVSLGISSPLP
jgi:hypothetical protein